jgi:hypothetical protein
MGRQHRYKGAFEKPMVSQSMGCHRDQVSERNEFIAREKIQGAVYRPDGSLELRSTKARQEMMNALRMHEV